MRRRLAGIIDRHRGLLHVAASRLAVLGGGLGVSLLVPSRLSSVEQGFFFTFMSLAALQTIFELGITTLVIQNVAYFSGQPTTDGTSWRGILDLDRFSRGYYRTAALLFLVLVGGAGSAFFLISEQEISPTTWMGPWLLLTSATCVSFLVSSRMAVLEGLGLIDVVYRIRTQSSLGLFLVFAIGVVAGAGLWSHPAALLVSQLVSLGVSHRVWRARCVLEQSTHNASSAPSTVDFALLRKNQNRFAVSAIAGFITANSLTPYCFHKFGPVVAGQTGLTLSVFYAAASLAMSRSIADAPQYGMWIGQGEFNRVRQAWRRNLQFSFGLSSLFALGLVFIRVLAPTMASQVTEKVLGLDAFIAASALIVVNTSLTTMSTVLRAFRIELLMWPSVGAAVVSLLMQLLSIEPAWYILGMAGFNGLIFCPLAYVLMTRRLGPTGDS